MASEDLRKLFDSLPEAIVLLNPEDSTVTLMNEKFKRLFSLHEDLGQAERDFPLQSQPNSKVKSCLKYFKL